MVYYVSFVVSQQTATELIKIWLLNTCSVLSTLKPFTIVKYVYETGLIFINGWEWLECSPDVITSL